jgi:molecular chaperone GrpE
LLHVSSAADQPPHEGSADAERVTAAELGEIGSELARLSVLLEREHERAAHREAIIDRLHEDNQRLRRGELQELHEPVRTALYRLHDMIKRESERWADPGTLDPTHVAPLLAAIADEIAESVARTGVERFTVKPGDRYDTARHRPVGTEPVTDPELDGAVVTARTDGFERGDRVVRRAEVIVGRFTSQDPSRDRPHDPPHDPSFDPPPDPPSPGKPE